MCCSGHPQAAPARESGPLPQLCRLRSSSGLCSSHGAPILCHPLFYRLCEDGSGIEGRQRVGLMCLGNCHSSGASSHNSPAKLWPYISSKRWVPGQVGGLTLGSLSRVQSSVLIKGKCGPVQGPGGPEGLAPLPRCSLSLGMRAAGRVARGGTDRGGGLRCVRLCRAGRSRRVHSQCPCWSCWSG